MTVEPDVLILNSGADLVGRGAEETFRTFPLATEKGIPASEIAERVDASSTSPADRATRVR